MSNEELNWRVVIPAVSANEVAHEPRFHALLAFARAMNVVWIAMEELARDGDVANPADRRRRVGLTFLIGGLLNDVRIAGNRLGEWYLHAQSFRELSEVWKGDPLGHPPLDALIDVRNKAVAHFDAEPYRTVLARESDLSDLRWASGRGPATGHVYYELADDLALHFALGKITSEAEYTERFDGLLTALTDVLLPLHQAGGKLIAEATREMGAQAQK